MAPRTLSVVALFRQCARDDPALAGIAELRLRALERHPARFVDLVVVVGGVARDVVAKVVADGLEHPQAAAAIPVLDGAEALHDPRVDPRLLAHLARGRLLVALAGLPPAFGERGDLRPAR